jgi:hypothetical protein
MIGVYFLQDPKAFLQEMASEARREGRDTLYALGLQGQKNLRDERAAIRLCQVAVFVW